MPHARTEEALPIIQYWHDAEVPAEIENLSASFRTHNPHLPYLRFNEEEAARFIAEHFTPREVAAFTACAVPSMQGDYFSYCACLALGGFYSDVGFRCLGPLQRLMDTIDQGVLFRTEKTGIVIHGFFAFRNPGHPLLRLTLDVATENIERQVAERVNMVTGPWIFNGLLQVRQAGTLDLPPPSAGKVDVMPLVRSFRQAIGDYERLEAAFEGIRIDPLTPAEWIAEPGARLTYKDSDLDWVNWCRRGETIFR